MQNRLDATRSIGNGGRVYPASVVSLQGAKSLWIERTVPGLEGAECASWRGHSISRLRIHPRKAAAIETRWVEIAVMG